MEEQLYKYFHENTKLFKDITYKKEYSIKKIKFDHLEQFENYELMDISNNDEFSKILKTRKSTRNFSNDAVERKSFLLLLNMAVYSNYKYKLAYPSAGGLNSIDIYVSVFNVDGIKKGVYFLDKFNGKIFLLKEGNYIEDYYKITLGQNCNNNSSFCINYVAKFDNIISKYDQRGYRYIFLDAGHISQNFYLVSNYLGIGSVSIGGFLDDEINRMLNLNVINEQCIYLQYFGRETDGNIG